MANSDETFLGKVSQLGLTLIITFLFNIALIGSSGYLLFDYSAEQNRLTASMFEMKEELSDLKFFQNIKNMALDEQVQNKMSEIDDIFEELLPNLRLNRLDAAFVQEVVEWRKDSISMLTSRRGQISGFVTDDILQEAYRDSTVSFYGSLIRLIDELTELIESWENESFEDHRVRVNTIQDSFLELSENLDRLKSQSSQVDTKTLSNLDQLEFRFESLGDEIEVMERRRFLSLMGLTLGVLLMIVWAIFASYHFFFKKPNV